MTERVKGWTAGPWHIDEVNHGLFNNRCLYVCDIPVVPENTHLIAAAPELVVALEAAHDSLLFARREILAQAHVPEDDFKLLDERILQSGKALAKAYGENNHD